MKLTPDGSEWWIAGLQGKVKRVSEEKDAGRERQERPRKRETEREKEREGGGGRENPRHMH